jgi:hypothetical protein
VRDVAFIAQVVAVGQILATTTVARIALVVDLDLERSFLGIELPFGMASEVKITPVGDSL